MVLVYSVPVKKENKKWQVKLAKGNGEEDGHDWVVARTTMDNIDEGEIMAHAKKELGVEGTLSSEVHSGTSKKGKEFKMYVIEVSGDVDCENETKWVTLKEAIGDMKAKKGPMTKSVRMARKHLKASKGGDDDDEDENDDEEEDDE
uniref:Uncharacterized protein n=1 Tax=Compsopogon caeruleus TaxID=31354 RepID=A0A7S1TEB3_9RHOD|mmetsp:Transcript_1894/g.3419  ORF Transcript_1894/g.3419 Transcript_1894/m.3419 type:complete len:146 (+) Transcript_1894:188-625(+)|eukprot:CAMPEP_0184679802 /NCGR_PEP_ID=MMETSP0312-20130426/2673_1 /TAXON_ID=31354 /ORGANISM="Compsopogon coeruleus, Strain SAG 36.94" /LENGTH=145 /DNA_ID=CAMNT_0027129501 /DNA_START=118 /DNA_END=555 /DNA_ORIENTATION=+